MSEKLKQCPFCGGEARIREVSIGDSYDGFTVECGNCAVDIGNINTEEEAIKLWNRRPNPWHTGTPTEKGWYLVRENLEIKSYEEVYWNGENWDYYGNPIDGKSILKWQKIEPYESSTILLRKENEDGLTD